MSPLNCHSYMNNIYAEILRVWNNETPDDFAIFIELYYEMFGDDYNIPYDNIFHNIIIFPIRIITRKLCMRLQILSLILDT